MNVAIGNNPQISADPRCPECGSGNSGIRRSKGFQTEYQGVMCHAQKQYRYCRECGAYYGAIKIKGEIQKRRRGA